MFFCESLIFRKDFFDDFYVCKIHFDIFINFKCSVLPLIIEIFSVGIFNSLLKNFISAMFAFPFSAGAAIFILYVIPFSLSSKISVISVF